MADVKIEEYFQEDEHEVLAILRLALGESATSPRSPEFWRWKHFANPFGASLILVARIEGQLAGVRAYLRWRFNTPGGSLQALRAVDTATHPNFLRKGVFRLLTLEANKRAEAAGDDLVFNTPNQKSLPGYLSMGWSVVGKPRVYVRPLRLSAFTTRREPRDSPDPTTVIPVGRACRFDRDDIGRQPLGLRTPRSLEYLRWRFQEHPTVPYRMIEGENGSVITRPNHRSGKVEVVVSELLGQDEGQLGLLRRGVEADYLVGSARPDAPEARRFRRAGFLPALGRGLTLVALPLTRKADQALRLDSWDISAGDLELL